MDQDLEFVPEEGENLKVSDPLKKLQDLKDKLKTCEKEKQEYLDGWQKERADFINYKKDEAERAARMAFYVREQFVEDILPVLDSFDLAFANKEAWEKVDKNWRAGVEYIHNQFVKVLEGYGVSAISAKTGDVFDPALHQSIETIETKEKEKDHTIASVIQTGYKIGERILRPARVKVFGYKE